MHPLQLSLLSPDGKASKKHTSQTILDETTLTDLGFNRIVEHMITDKKRPEVITTPAFVLCRSIEEITYRQDVLEDLLNHQDIVACMETLLPQISRLHFYVMHPGKMESTPLQETIWRIRELEHYGACVDNFYRAFQKGTTAFRSAGLQAFKEIIESITVDPAYAQLIDHLPALLERINRIKSVTIGVNVNDGLIPIEAALLSVNEDPFKESTFLEKIVSATGERSVGRLHSVKDSEFYSTPSMIPLFKDVADVLNHSVKPLQKALKQFAKINGLFFVNQVDEFLFYLGAIKLIRKLEASGFQMVRPKALPAKSKTLYIEGMYNIDLALQRESSDGIVCNDFSMDDMKRLFILTGPNSDGKNTFLQSIGLVQILTQIGLFVPASRAEISLCDNVFTHYPNLEDPSKDSGRFGEEADRLKILFQKATEHSLLLLNETLSSTSMGEKLSILHRMSYMCSIIWVSGQYFPRIYTNSQQNGMSSLRIHGGKVQSRALLQVLP